MSRRVPVALALVLQAVAACSGSDSGGLFPIRPDVPDALRACITATASGARVVADAIEPESGTFESRWEVTPLADDTAATVGLGNAGATDALANAIRLNLDGSVDALNGDAYAAVEPMAWRAGETYEVVAVVDVPARRYSVTVVAPGGDERLLARDFAFPEAVTPASLDWIVASASSGAVKTCRKRPQPQPEPTPEPTPEPSPEPTPEPEPTRAIDVTPAVAGFGTVTVGERVTANVVVTNTGTGPVTVSGASATGAGVTLSGPAFPLSLAAGEATQVTVAWAPTAASTLAGQVAIASDAAGSPAVVALSGTALAPAPTPTPTPTLPPASGPLPAFPGAEGGGALSKGGRGGAVYEVTTLADSGTGSLRACVEASGPRTCVFRVSGVIKLGNLKELQIRNPYLTIAGQTAPGGGIAIDGSNVGGSSGTYGRWAVRVMTHDVVIRYVRVWLGANSYGTWNGAFALGDGAYNVILDHVSTLWATDKAVSLWNGGGTLKNFTMQYSIAGESLASHSTNLITGGSAAGDANGMTDLDFHHNYLPTGGWRNPLFKARSGRFVNNVVYNWKYWATEVGGGGFVDFVGNVYRRGPISSANGGHQYEIGLFDYNSTCPDGRPSVFLADNRGANDSTGTRNWEAMASWVGGEGNTPENGPVPSSYRRSGPLASATTWTSSGGFQQSSTGVPIRATALVGDGSNLWTELKGTVGASARLDCDGNWVANRDAADARAVAYFGNGGPSTQATNESSYGGKPALASGTACADADRDGMPDRWETARGLNPSNAGDRNTIDASGYTNLERYLAGY